jgi:hypothetical protein
VYPYPHVYFATASGAVAGSVSVQSAGLPELRTEPPPEFGVARAGGLAWEQLECEVEGTLERIAGVSQFTRYLTRATLTLATGTDTVKARALLERAEKVCLVANSLRGERSLEIQLVEASA